MPRPFLGLLLAALSCLLPLSAQETPPNIVILFADDLGINDLGCFGRKDQRTPNLDKLAADGARFTQAYAAASVCSPSRAALMTGQSPARLKITTFLTGRTDRSSHRLLSAPINLNLPAGVPTIAELLKPKGYVEAVIGRQVAPRRQGPSADRSRLRRILPRPREPRRGIAARRQRRARSGGLRCELHREEQGQALPALPRLR